MNTALEMKIEKEYNEQKEFMLFLDKAWENEQKEKKGMKKVWKELFAKGYIKVTNFYGEHQIGINFEKHTIKKEFKCGSATIEVYSCQENLKDVVNTYERFKANMQSLKNDYKYM